MHAPGTILFDDSRSPDGENLLFTDPVAIIRADTPDAVPSALAALDRAQTDGLWAAGLLSYELGYLLEDRLVPLLPSRRDVPLIWLGLYARPRPLSRAEAGAFIDVPGSASAETLELELDFPAYAEALATIKELIAAGDIYQANLTLRARFALSGDALALYRDLARKQPVAYGALLCAGDFSVLSRSPELFVANRGGTLSTRPMKGTARRGRSLAEDEAGRRALAADSKNRAENLMIVDLLRNDLGRISTIGSVSVSDLFSVETFRTLHQMTSGITAQLKPGIGTGEIIANLFPCGSITGAPKIRAMEVISQVEASPRGAYTGALGYIAPSGDFCFNVAIRTATIWPDGRGEIGIGGGIVADSEAADEYREALLKLKFFTDPAAPLGLIETLLWERGRGFALLERHLERLAASAAYFGIALGDPRAALAEAEEDFSAARMRVRLLLDERAGLSVTAVPLPPAAPGPFRFMLAEETMRSDNPFLAHKTTNRAFYDAPRQRAVAEHGVDEVVFCNERGEVTEGSITNIFIARNGLLLTPALDCGLLPGTLRAEMIAAGKAQEAVLTPDDLAGAEAIYLGNSLRGLMVAEWVRQSPPLAPDA